MDLLARQWAAFLRERGVHAGDRVALISNHGKGFVAAALGAFYLGAVIAPLSAELRGDSLRRPLLLFAPRVVVVDAEFAHLVDQIVRDLRDESGPVPEIVHSDDELRSAVAQSSAIEEPESTKLSQPCLIMSTSGTTGPSKGSLWDFGTLEAWADTYRAQLAYGQDDRIYCCTPLMHANAFVAGLATAIYSGCSIAHATRFSVSGFWRDVMASNSTTANILGSMIHVLLADSTKNGASIPTFFRSMLVSSCTASAYEQIVADWGIFPVCAYGLTDFGNLTISAAGQPTPAGSCGRAVDKFEIRLVDSEDDPVAVGRTGELVVRPRSSWSAPQEYFGMPIETLASRCNLWFHTGDLLRQDEDGWFYFAGRLKEAMRYRGENVSAFEVESAFLACSEVREAAVYAVPSELGEDEIVAAIVARDEDVAIDLSDLITRVSCELPYFAVPRFVRVLTALPKNGSQRVVKAELVKDGIALGTWDRLAAGIDVARNRARASKAAAIANS